jgi:hypothetical protein
MEVMKKPLIAALFLLSTLILSGQDRDAVMPLPRGFQEIQLGLTLEQVREALEAEPYFAFRGDPDVSLLARPNEQIIEAEGAHYIQRGIFQFSEKILYSITLVFNPSLMDFSTLFSTLEGKYGPFTSLDPSLVIWENEEIRMILEKPATLKYLHRPTFEALSQQSRREESFRALDKADFLERL